MGISERYGPSLALLTDQYELTMACGYWRAGMKDHEAVFHLFFRALPFGGGYAVAAGIEDAVDWLIGLRFDDEDLAYLAGLTAPDDTAQFDAGFLGYLRDFVSSCEVDAVPEGTVVFPHEPLVRVKGPIIEAQLVETALLNIVNFQTLIATKAARVVDAAGGDPVVDFGLRRAQGVDGGVSMSRACYVGGCASTSNVLAGRLFGIPVTGTHAHSWVMAFDTEVEAFEAWARALPANAVFLVDTYDTLDGVRRAVEVGRGLRERGHRLRGIRLDSGDLDGLARLSRALLDEAGFVDAVIVASGDLDEHAIAALKQKGAPIGMWGVGTRMATAFDEPALGGVYKLAGVKRPGAAWSPRLKVSEEAEKTTLPGVLQTRRYRWGDRWMGDVLWNELTGIEQPARRVDLAGPEDRILETDPAWSHTDLLEPRIRDGVRVASREDLVTIRDRARLERARLFPAVRRLDHPERYPVAIEAGLLSLKRRLVRESGGRPS